MAFFTKITVDGTDVTSKVINYEVTDTVNEDATEAKIDFVKAISSDLTLTAGMAIVISNGSVTDSDHTIFQGTINELKKDGSIYRILAYDKMFDLSKIIFTTSYDKDVDSEAGKISAIAKDVIETFGLLTSSEADSGTDFLVTKFISKNDNVAKKLEELKNLLNWQLFYDPSDDTIHFEPFGTTSFATTIQTGVNISNVPEWRYNYDNIANTVKVIGAPQEVETTENGQIGVTSGYSQTSVLLTNTPESVKVFAGAANPPVTLRTGGVFGATQSATFDYFVDKQRKLVFWNTANYTPGAADFVQTQYSYLSPITVRGTNDASIASFGTRERVIHNDSVVKPEDAELLMQKTLDKFSAPFVTGDINVTGVFGMRAGMTVSVVDTISDETRSVVIRNITHRYPETIVELIVGDEPLPESFDESEIRKRLQELERKFAGDQSFVTEVRNVSMGVRSKLRYLEVTTGTIGANTRIYGHNTQSAYASATFTYGGSAASHSTNRLTWPNRLYEETFFDTSFKDVGNTTATWDTSARELTFAAGEVGRSSDIWLNNETPVSVDITGIFTGSLTFEVTGDGGSTFETVVINSGVQVSHNFGVSDTSGVQWRATEDAASSAALTNLQIRVNV